MRKLFRFRIRTLLFAVAALAVLLATGSWLWWRHRVDSALEATLATGPDIYWEFDLLKSTTKDDYIYLLSDHKRVANRLMGVLKSDDSLQRRMNAIRAMRMLSARSGSFQNRSRLLPQLLDLTCDTETPSTLVPAVAETIAAWIPSTGVTSEERARICEKALAASGDQRIAWIAVLDSIGGRKEVMLLLQFGNSHDDAQLYAVFNSQFRGVTWAGMLPHVARWIRDPLIVDKALEFLVLSYTSDGRDVLLTFLSDRTQPIPSRTKAVQQLTQTVAGIDLLASACSDQQFADNLSDLLGADCRQHLAAERTKLMNRNGDELWGALIDGLDPMYWFPTSGITLPVSAEAQFSEIRERNTQSSLACLRLLSNKSDVTTQAEWRAWRETQSRDIIKLDDFLRIVLDHPEMIENTTILRRIVPQQLGYIPDNCIPLYEQMLQSDNLTMQAWACRAMLIFTESAEAVEVAICLIEQSTPGDATSCHPGEIALLRGRFAVNFFWDTDAWRNWAMEARSNVARPTVQ